MEKSFSTGRIIGLIGAALLIIGAFLPWGKVAGMEITGLSGDGQITIGIGIIAILLLLIKKVPLWITSILGIIAIIIGGIDFNGMNKVVADFSDLAGTEGTSDLVNIGSGIYATILGGAVMLIGTIVGYVQKRK